MSTLRHLQIFVEVATCGKMNEAAQKLYLTQPTVSQSISELEGYFKTRLFERLSKKLLLTPAGEQLLPYAKNVLLAYHQMNDFMNGISGHCILKIGASATAGNYYINKIISEFNHHFPEVATDVFIRGSQYLIAELQNGHLDIALIEAEPKARDITATPVMTDHLHIVCGRNHPLFKCNIVDVSDLNDQYFVFREDSSASRRMLLNFLADNKIHYHSNWSCNNTDALKTAVINNRGLSLISDTLSAQECENGFLKRLEIKDIDFQRDIYLAYHRDKHISKPLNTFIKLCRELQLSSDGAFHSQLNSL